MCSTVSISAVAPSPQEESVRSNRPAASEHPRVGATEERPDGHFAPLPYEVRSEEDCLDVDQDFKVTKDMLDLARHIVQDRKLERDKFEDRHEAALVNLAIGVAKLEHIMN